MFRMVQGVGGHGRAYNYMCAISILIGFFSSQQEVIPRNSVILQGVVTIHFWKQRSGRGTCYNGNTPSNQLGLLPLKVLQICKYLVMECWVLIRSPCEVNVYIMRLCHGSILRRVIMLQNNWVCHIAKCYVGEHVRWPLEINDDGVHSTTNCVFLILNNVNNIVLQYALGGTGIEHGGLLRQPIVTL